MKNNNPKTKTMEENIIEQIEKSLFNEVINKRNVKPLDYITKNYNITRDMKNDIGHIIDVVLSEDFIEENEAYLIKGTLIVVVAEVASQLADTKKISAHDFGIS